jgi:hypothetical protein
MTIRSVTCDSAASVVHASSSGLSSLARIRLEVIEHPDAVEPQLLGLPRPVPRHRPALRLRCPRELAWLRRQGCSLGLAPARLANRHDTQWV